MKLYLKNIIKETYTNNAGTELYKILENYILQGKYIELSLRNSSAISSSFFNSSFEEIINRFGLDTLKKHVKLIEASKHQADILKVYFDASRKRHELIN